MIRHLLDRITGTRYIDDPVFGRLRFQRAAQFWEGFIDFAPTGTRVEVLVDGGPDGPVASQRQALGDLLARYEMLAEQSRHAIRRELASRHDQTTLATYEPLVKLVCLNFPVLAPSGTCDLSFDDQERGWHYTIHCREWQPQLVEVDTC